MSGHVHALAHKRQLKFEEGGGDAWSEIIGIKYLWVIDGGISILGEEFVGFGNER